MKIVQISGFDTLGIQVNGYLLHEHFQMRGHNSSMYVHLKYSNDPKVHPMWRRYLGRLNNYIARIACKLSFWSIFPIEAFQLIFRRDILNADILHLQLTYNAQFYSIFLTPILSWLRGNKPTIVSIHDMFMTTGHCVYALSCSKWKSGCGNCPGKDIPFPITFDTSKVCWWIKKIAYAMSNIHLVAGSPWQLRMIAQSPILGRLPVHYIPYGVDTRHYYVRDKKKCRARFGISDNEHVLSFRSVPHGKNFKGTSYIIEALKAYSPAHPTTLLTFETVGGLEELADKYTLVQLPWTNDDQDILADALNAADLFLMPSIAEGFGLMAIESLACATPVITFEGTALPETIDAPFAGLSVSAKDSAALSHAISVLLADPERRAIMAQNGLALVDRKHTLEQYADHFLELYESLQPKQQDLMT